MSVCDADHLDKTSRAIFTIHDMIQVYEINKNKVKRGGSKDE